MTESISTWQETVIFFGTFLGFMTVARIGTEFGFRRKKDRIGLASSPTHRVAAEESIPNYLLTVPTGAHLYHSGQAKLFTEEIQSHTEATGQHIDEIKIHKVPKLPDYLPDLSFYDNEFFRTRTGNVSRKGYSVPVNDDQVILGDLVRTSANHKGTAFVRAGPRVRICFRPSQVVACIVTCGGLCPGLNDVIHELVQMLYYNYSVDRIYGIRCGYRGFYDPDYLPFMELTPERVRPMHKTGGTLLGSSRGGFDLDKILGAIVSHDITQVYIIGGDGTHRGASIIYNEVRRLGLKISVVGIPKTIDNDIGIIDRSFGFNTAVEEAEKAVLSAKVEASCTPFGIGLVKLMGRYAGFIAAHTTLASCGVDLCLIPEIPIQLEGDSGILNHIKKALEKNGHCTIVLAEGAGGNLLQFSDVKDASGNVIPDDIGLHLKSVLKNHFRKLAFDVSIKYNDPSYMVNEDQKFGIHQLRSLLQIRSVPANASDSIYCMILAQNAVHGAMSGYTGFTSGLVNNRTVMLPITLITEASPTFLNPNGHTWERVVRTTHQPFILQPEPAEVAEEIVEPDTIKA